MQPVDEVKYMALGYILLIRRDDRRRDDDTHCFRGMVVFPCGEEGPGIQPPGRKAEIFNYLHDDHKERSALVFVSGMTRRQAELVVYSNKHLKARKEDLEVLGDTRNKERMQAAFRVASQGPDDIPTITVAQLKDLLLHNETDFPMSMALEE